MTVGADGRGKDHCVALRGREGHSVAAMDSSVSLRLSATGARLRARRLHLHTQREPIVVMRTDCPVCRSEGLAPRSQLLIRANGREIIAILFQGADEMLAADEIGLSEAAWRLLGASEGEWVAISHPPAVSSLGFVRSRIFGTTLEPAALDEIVADVVAGRYSDVQLAAFITAGSALPLTDDETIALTGAMARAGEQLSWDREVVDKHSVGGLPGNRTTPIVVAIAATAGLTIPKTSSRAITSPAGTADAMETVTQVDLDLDAIRRVVDAEGGCLAWGGALNLSPADDIFIGVERQLDIDPEGQLIASVLSKKIAAGARKLVLDIPVGPTAKVRSAAAGQRLAMRMRDVASHFALETVAVVSEGTQPVGRAIGPALEMRDVLRVLRCEAAGPGDLRQRALEIAAAVLELGGAAAQDCGLVRAGELLESGAAYRKFERICVAQGGFREPVVARLERLIPADRSGRVTGIDNRKIGRIAKFAGAPDDAGAGLVLHVRLGDEVRTGQPLMTLYADTPSELAYALDYARSVGLALTIGP
jgi:thymidine phosphorylase